MASKIYTKTGDKGNTSLIGGTKVPKSHIRIESYGTVDELNSYIGLCADQLTDADSKAMLKEIQDRLFTIGSSLACDPDKEPLMKIPDLKKEDVELLEKAIDTMNGILPVMKFFILPGGHPADLILLGQLSFRRNQGVRAPVLGRDPIPDLRRNRDVSGGGGRGSTARAGRHLCRVTGALNQVV